MSVIDELFWDDPFDPEGEDDGSRVSRHPPEPKSEDVSFDDYGPRFPEARSDLVCGDCGAPMEIRPSKFGCFYGCTGYPACKGTHGAHPDGSPLGIPADKATREARVRAHFVFDQLWKSKRMSRRDAYQWMRTFLNLSHRTAHIGQLSAEQCDKLITLVFERYPSLHTRYSRIAWSNDDDV